MKLISNGTVIDPASGTVGEFDVIVDQGVIHDVVPRGQARGGTFIETLDASGRWIVPGFIDLHVHLREPGFEWKETVRSGTEAAVLGGYTTVCCMPNTQPRNDHGEVTRYILDKAAAAGLARVLPIGAVTKELKGEEMAPLTELRNAGCIAFSDDGEPIHNAGLMRRALEWCLALDATISCHEEDKSLSCGGCMNESALSTRMGLRGMPKVAEDVMVARDIELARATGGKVHICHVSTARSVELIRRAKNDGIRITAEVTPHHLVLTEEAVGEYDTAAKMSPPLREQADVEALRLGIKDGTIDAIASDHAPHENDSKRVEFSKASFGILGLQTSLSLVIGLVREGVISRERAVDLCATGPARSFGIEGGNLKRGSRADITLIDPERRWRFGKEEIRSLSTNTPFLGMEMLGAATDVLVDGRTVLSGGVIKLDR
ncbi:MAG: Dihydroorotase [Pseudomonadota bacterium]